MHAHSVERLSARKAKAACLAFAAATLAFAACSTAPVVVQPVVQVPIELRGGMPTATVSIAGRPLKLFIDLAGYSAVALTPGELEQVRVSFLPETIRSTNASGEIYESRRFIAPDVSLAGVSFGDVEGSEFIFPASAAPPDRNGYVGFALFSRFLLVLDYPNRLLRLYPAGSSDALVRECGSRSFPLEFANGVPQSVVRTEHGRLVFSWDTGSIHNVIRPSVIGKTFQAADSFRSQPPPYAMEKFVLGEIDFAPQKFLLIDYRGIAVDGVLGTDFFESRVVCFDFARGIGAIRR